MYFYCRFSFQFYLFLVSNFYLNLTLNLFILVANWQNVSFI